MRRLRIDQQPHHLFRPEVADKLADQLTADDDGWIYTASHDPKRTGYSFVEITDEAGEKLGRL